MSRGVAELGCWWRNRIGFGWVGVGLIRWREKRRRWAWWKHEPSLLVVVGKKQKTRWQKRDGSSLKHIP
jgi:hypothetical protein